MRITRLANTLAIALAIASLTSGGCGPSAAVFAERMSELTDVKAQLDGARKAALLDRQESTRRIADLEAQSRDLSARLAACPSPVTAPAPAPAPSPAPIP